MEKVDYKKLYKDLYQPKEKPALTDVPEMLFIQVKGKGDPNTGIAYKNAMEILYGLSWGIKMSKMSGFRPEGYFEHVVPPLEGLWWEENKEFDGRLDKENFCWISMIRQPEFVTPEVFEWAKENLLKKKPDVNFSTTTLEVYREGLCGQIMHIGPYDDEPVTIEIMDEYIRDAGYIPDFGQGRFHHEIYLNDPRRTAPEKLKTVIRHPIRKKDA